MAAAISTTARASVSRTPATPTRASRPPRPDEGAEEGEEHLPRPLRAAARIGLPRRLPVLLPGGRRAAPHRGLQLRLGGGARPAIPPADLPRARGGGRRRAGAGRGR